MISSLRFVWIFSLLIHTGDGFIVGQVTCDNIMEFYADGVLIESSSDWTQVSTVTLPDTTTVLGFFCRDQGVVAGIKGFFSNGIKTDGTWRCIADDIHGWEDPDFDDSAWPLAILPAPTVWGTRPLSLFGQADWIWTAGGVHDSRVYCRKTIPKDQRCTSMLTSLTLLTKIVNESLANVLLGISGGFTDVNTAVQSAANTALAGSIITLEQIDRDLLLILKELYDD
ncbi:hypothetical protein LOTGIDRAFT_238267 [Lottia gigantea]|uniref:Uncharacterized protein n=1 Tax=Lottia gigantea TaxID=225164 RepID=V4B617_LOTGI|nr:hypothetical protein LOTGIDRAFT_238267 [Lottia gigantea]ESP01527.1 hypothetical protein LOTGIDRAFT_238267 [Lottia gigantea]